MYNAMYNPPTQPELDAITNEARRQRALLLKSLVRRLFTRRPAGLVAPAQ